MTLSLETQLGSILWPCRISRARFLLCGRWRFHPCFRNRAFPHHRIIRLPGVSIVFPERRPHASVSESEWISFSIVSAVFIAASLIPSWHSHQDKARAETVKKSIAGIQQESPHSVLFKHSTPEEWRAELLALQRLKAAGPSDPWALTHQEGVEAARAILEPYRPFLEDSAKAWKIPTADLAAVLLANVSEKMYLQKYNIPQGIVSLDLDFHIPAFRILDQWLRRHPDFKSWLERARLPDFITNFIASAGAGADSTAGLMQIRGRNVVAHDLWSRFKIDANEWPANRVKTSCSMTLNWILKRWQSSFDLGVDDWVRHPPKSEPWLDLSKYNHDSSFLDTPPHPSEPFWGPDWGMALFTAPNFAGAGNAYVQSVPLNVIFDYAYLQANHRRSWTGLSVNTSHGAFPRILLCVQQPPGLGTNPINAQP